MISRVSESNPAAAYPLETIDLGPVSEHPQGQGDLVGLTLICPCHLGAYDLRTGQVVDGPPPASLRAYPVDASDGRIRVHLSREER